ncbi:MAG TPA: transglutaminase family protein [Candidatus Aquabacterium excrementipullorum]|nr:transglutaminase family protein [Candidatus Aquabacterium excrementipullorum]
MDSRTHAPEAGSTSPYLAASTYIDHGHPDVVAQAAAIARQATSTLDLVKRCFEFVRDEIQHSHDFKRNPVTCKASDVLRHGTGYCYAKSHLLAALLRANGVPTGLCYQRLSVSDAGAPYCLHGLNAVWLAEHGWYRIDARGNKPGIQAAFTPPIEALAFAIREPMERDLPEIWAEPLPCVVKVLEKYTDEDEVARHLPDVPLTTGTSTKPEQPMT